MNEKNVITVGQDDIKAIAQVRHPVYPQGESLGDFICGDNCSCSCDDCSNCDTVCVNTCDYAPPELAGSSWQRSGLL